jgi:hypothetical protein
LLGGLTDIEAGIERLPSISGERTSSSAPAWLAYDRHCLRFDAYVQEAVHERPGESYRVRYCQLFFYPQDGTLQVTEKHQPNSGMLHGEKLKKKKKNWN